VIVIDVGLFLAETIARKAAEKYEAAKRAKWAGHTTDPPTTQWPAAKGYACFLSHYKVEAASDARFMHDMLAKMLHYPVFLDSSDLVDLRSLITDGVADSDVILVLATKGVWTRPWCLLEMYHAMKIGTPVVLINIKGGGFDIDDACAYINNIESEMGQENPEGLVLLREHLGDDLGEMQINLLTTLEEHRMLDVDKRLAWNPQASDIELIASLKDVAEAMALKTQSVLKWKGDLVERIGGAIGGGTKRRRGSAKMMKVVDQPVMHIACAATDAMGDARVLQTELSMLLGRFVSMPSGAERVGYDANSLIVLLTKDALCDPALLISVHSFAIAGKPIIPVCLIGRGYDYRSALTTLADLRAALTLHRGATAIAELEVMLAGEVDSEGNTATIDSLQATLSTTLPRIIAVNWEPQAGKNQTDAAVANVVSRHRKMEAINLKLANLAKLTKSPRAPTSGRGGGMSRAATGAKLAKEPASSEGEPPSRDDTVLFARNRKGSSASNASESVKPTPPVQAAIPDAAVEAPPPGVPRVRERFVDDNSVLTGRRRLAGGERRAGARLPAPRRV